MMMGGWGYSPYGGYYAGGGFWWMSLLMAVVEILFWGAIIVLAIRFFKHHAAKGHSGSFSGTSSRAVDILRERFARGEIDSEEFQRRKQELER